MLHYHMAEMIVPPSLSLVIVGLLAAFATYLGGSLTLRLVRKSTVIFGLTSGLVIGLALFDLLPEALHEQDDPITAATVAGMVLLGLGASLVLHHLPETSAKAGRAGRIALIAHSVLDGVGIGLAFQISTEAGWIVAAAILAHDMADGANMAGLSVASNDRASARKWLLANSLAPLLGIAIGQLLPMGPAHFALLLALFAGAFLYIGVFELLPRSLQAQGPAKTALTGTIGLIFMAGVVSLAHG